MKSTFFRESSIVLAADCASSAMKWLAVTVLLRSLGPETQGAWSLVTSTCACGGLLASLGVEVAVVFAIGREIQNVVKVLVNSLAVVSIASLSLTAAACAGCLLFSSHFLSPQQAEILLAALGGIALFPLCSITVNAFLARKQFFIYSLLKVLNAASFLCFVYLLLLTNQMTLGSAVLAYFVGPAIVAILGLAAVYAKSDRKLEMPSYDLMKSLTKYGMAGFWGTLFQFLNYRLDLFFIAYFLGVKAVGIYAAAVLIAECLNYLPNAVGAVIFPFSAATNDARNNRVTPLVAQRTFFLTSVFAFGCFFLLPYAIPMAFGADYGAATVPCQALLPGIAFLSIWKVVMNDLAGRGHPQYKSYTSLWALLLTVPLNCILIPSYGILGAAIASSAAYVFAALMAVYCFVRLTHVAPQAFFRMQPVRA